MLNPRSSSEGTTRVEAVVRYWGRKSKDLAALFIRRYTAPDQVVADFFGGSGIFARTALELGRRAIYVDLNPFAYLIARTTITASDHRNFARASEGILSNSKVRFRKRRVHECDRSKFFSIQCKCGNPVEVSSILYRRKYYRTEKPSRSLSGLRLSICQSIPRRNGIIHEALVALHPELTTQVLSFAVQWLVKNNFVHEQEVPVQARFASRCPLCGGDSLVLQESEGWLIDGQIRPAFWYPDDPLRYDDGTTFLKQRGVARISELFTARNLAAIASIWHEIRRVRAEAGIKNCLRLAFMATLAQSSKMCRQGGGAWPVNSYWIPRTYLVRNPYLVFKNAVNQVGRLLMRQSPVSYGGVHDVLLGKAEVCFLLDDATQLQLPRNSVDYVIVDPPHTDEAQFFELSLFYTSWLETKLDFGKELIINRKQRKDVKTYLEMLGAASRRVYQSLKRNGHYTVILHDNSRSFLAECRDTLLTIGFDLLEENHVDEYTVYTFQK